MLGSKRLDFLRWTFRANAANLGLLHQATPVLVSHPRNLAKLLSARGVSYIMIAALHALRKGV